eukprot:jgi/Tetstr1/437866/TSEL_026506.t1
MSSLFPAEPPPPRGPPPPPRQPMVQPAEVYKTWNGHKKVVTERRHGADPEDGLATVHFSSRVVRKDLWHEEIQALERQAHEHAPASNPTRRRRPVRGAADSAPDSGVASPPANKPTSSGATKTLRSIGKGKSMRFAVTGQGGEGVEGAAVPKEQSTADCVQTTQAAAATGPAPAPAPDEPAARPSARAAPAPAAGSSLGGTSLELSKSLASHLGVPVPGDAGDADGENSVAAVPVVAQETVYDLNGLPFRNLNKGTGGVADLARSSIKALELSAATQATNYGNSLAGASLTGDLLSAHDASTAGDGGNRTPKSDDASSLKSLEYSRNFADASRQDLAWQAQLAAAAAAACDPEITMEEIARMGEHHTDIAQEESHLRTMSRMGSAPLYTAKSFLLQVANNSRKNMKEKAGWQSLSETTEYRLTAAGVLEVRKKGTWDMSEEERQRRLRAQMPMKKRFQMGLARLFGWDQEEAYVRPEKVVDPKAVRKEATTRRELDFKRMLPSETLDAHKGTIKAVIQFNERIVTGGSDGLVHVWRHWDELRHEYMRTASMRQTKSMLTEIGVDLKATSMFAHGDDDEDSNHKSFISRGGRPQTCEWQLHQVMDHGSAITAMVQAMLENKEHHLNEPLLAVATRSGSLFLWATANPKEWQCAKEIRVASVPLCLVFHKGRLLAGCDDGTIHAWRLADMEHGIIEGHSSAVWALAVTGDHIFSGSSDGVMKIWLHEGTEDTYDHRVTVRCSTGGVWSISDDTEVMTAADDEMLHVIVKSEEGGWDLTKTFEHGHKGPVVAQQVVNIEWLLTCSPGRGAHVKAWNRLSWECVWQVTDEVGPSWCLSHIHSSIFVGSSDQRVHVFRSYYPEWLYDRMDADKEDFRMADADSVFGDASSPSHTLTRRMQSSQKRQPASPLMATSMTRHQDSLPPMEQCESPSRVNGRPMSVGFRRMEA